MNVITQPVRQKKGASEEGALTLRELLEQRDRLTKETGHYYGVEELTLRDSDPVKFERFYSRLHSCVLAAREVARYVAASPGGREMGESLWALATPEGDSLALSLGFFSHCAAMPVAVRYMINEGYEENPGINDGDVFMTDDGLTGGAPHPGDTYCYVPIVVKGEVVAWAVGLNHIMEAGAPVAGSWPSFCVDTFMDGFVFPPMKTGENLHQATWWNSLWKRRTRAAALNILDDKMRLAGCAMIHKAIHEIVEEFGFDYYRRAIREIIEESRRRIMDNIGSLMVPGTQQGCAFRIAKYKGMQQIWPHADQDHLIHVRQSVDFDERGRIVVDMEGTSRWGYHAFNGFPGGADCALYLSMVNTFSHNTKVTAAINLAVESKYPKGSLYNPDNEFASTAVIWAQSVMMNSLAFNAMNRSMFARGYLEEAFTTDGDWEGVQGSGVLEDGTPYGFTNFEWVGGVSQGAFCYRDGQPLSWAEWTQLSNVGNAEEFEYLIPSFFYLGRSLLPGFCGHGKYRGGLGQSSVHWMVEPGQRLGVSHSGGGTAITTFLGIGMSGGYPPPNAFTVTAQGTNLDTVIAESGETPRNALELIEQAAEGSLEVDELRVWNYDPPELEMKHNDLWANAAGASGGWGDPIERETALILEDLNMSWVPYEHAARVYGVVASENGDGMWTIDEAATKKKRAEIRKQRLAKGRPVSEWWQDERRKVLDRDFSQAVGDMYRSSTSFAKFDKEFRNFWSLDSDFVI